MDETDTAGGFSGAEGEYQLPHIASTYAALLSLVIVIDDDNYERIKKGIIVEKIHQWLLSLKQPNGSFFMHTNGETDVRAMYCALVIINLLGIKDKKLTENCVEWLVNCQSYEGGFGGDLMDEAHGGYAFCGLSALLFLIDNPKQLYDLIDVDSLISWMVKRQYAMEGGCSGRTNKLVDGCYSTWVGSLSPILEAITGAEELINREKLENYILCCCQDKGQFGGFKDKPTMRVDFYHTNYVSCGLSICNSFHFIDEKIMKEDGLAFSFKAGKLNDNCPLELVDPVFTVPIGTPLRFKKYMERE
ncbi:unnamed protein product [Ambrosiozyma monospora]|uniref:Unnamed protein product n=1 Tax=Ambrosiozyma monospora TaxID=43982 RepID=A0ACB5T201_AMBMO|nr:unnamed protein product [Ambrosiozyma monospora]